jgi:hypothetical protein
MKWRIKTKNQDDDDDDDDDDGCGRIGSHSCFVFANSPLGPKAGYPD